MAKNKLSEELALIALAKSGDPVARNKVVSSNLGLVCHFIKKERGRTNHSVEFQDLVQEGAIGLMRAVEKFDFKRGTKFSTYAGYWIRRYIKSAILNMSKTVRVPLPQQQLYCRAQKLLTAKLGRSPNVHELAGYMRQKVSIVKVTSRRYSYSLDRPTNRALKLAVLPGDDVVTKAEIREEIARILPLLEERQRAVIELRFGFGGTDPQSLEEIGKRFCVSKERIRQIQKKAVGKLRNYCVEGAVLLISD